MGSQQSGESQADWEAEGAESLEYLSTGNTWAEWLNSLLVS